MTDDLPEVTPRDAIEIAQRALAKANRVDELEAEIDDLHDEVARLQLRLSEDDESRPYESRTLDEKIGIVREYAFRKATQTTGRSQLDYKAVMFDVFDGDPGPAHCYKLMRLAGQARGFEFREDDRPKVLRCDASEAKRGLAFFSENKTTSEGVGQ